MDGGLTKGEPERELRGGMVDPRAGRRSEPDIDTLVDIRAVVRAVWRRKWTVIAVVLLCQIATALIVLQMTPRYTANALAMLEAREAQVIDLEEVLPGVGTEKAALQSEIEIIRSTQLLARVVDKLRLDEDPEFNPGLSPSGGFDPMAWVAAAAPGVFGASASDPAEVDEIVRAERARRSVIDAVASRLDVSLLRSTFVISIRFVSSDPRKAALVANTIADQYIVDQLEAKFEATERATVWLSNRVDELKARVVEAEDRVEDFKASQAMVDGQGVALTTQQVAELNSNLIAARADRAEAQARYDQVSRLLSQGGDIASAAEVLSSPLIIRLREQEAGVLRNEAELATRYGDRHPRMINVRAELVDLRRAIEAEVRKIAQNSQNELRVAEAREAALQSDVQALEQKALGQAQSSVKVRQLEREAEATRTIYENFLSRFKETAEQQDLQSADARIISRAEPPNAPSAPDKTLAMGVATAFGVFAGLGIVFLLEMMNNAFRSPRAFESETGLTVLANIPRLPGRKNRRDVFDYIWNKPNSAAAEAVRNLRTSLLLSNVDAPPKIVMVTSSLPGEGKSTLAVMLGLTTSRMGKKTLVIDCDLRRPALSTLFGGDDERSLIGVVSGRIALADAVIADEREPLFHVLTSTTSQANPADIFSSRRFLRLMEKVAEQYEFVVLDTPPTLAVSDPRIVAKLADVTLFVTKWDATPREAVKNGLRQLTDVGAPVAGAALTLVDFRKQASYDSENYGYYRRDYDRYYVD